MTPPSVQDCLAPPPRFFQEDFAFVVCQHATENRIKQHLTGTPSLFRLAFSRPGVITFKVLPQQLRGAEQPPAGEMDRMPSNNLPKHPLIRQAGWVLGQVRGDQAVEMVEQVLSLSGNNWDALHVFSRDPAIPGDDGFEPGNSPLTEEIGQQIRRAWSLKKWSEDISVNQTCAVGARVLDVILVEPNHWIVGYHRADSSEVATSWPGGAYCLELPETAISRAYLKVF